MNNNRNNNRISNGFLMRYLIPSKFFAVIFRLVFNNEVVEH